MDILIPIFKIVSILFFISFSLYIPLLYILDKKNALQITIPLSISIEIIFGYIFYNLGHLKMFPFLYFLIILIINTVFIWKIKKKNDLFLILKKIFHKKNNIEIATLVLFFLALILTVFTRFYDSLNTIAPGNIDTIDHLNFLNDLKNIGHIQLAYYAPGFHLFLYPLTFFVSNSYIYRFAGPVIGILIILSVFLYMKRYLKPTVLLFMIILFSVPIYNQLTLQTISFFSSSLTFIFLIAFIYALNKNNKIDEKKSLIICAISSVSLAISVPYFYVGLIPAVVFLFIISLLNKKILPTYHKYLIKVIFVLIIFGLIVSFGHVLLQTKILNNQNISFPRIKQVKMINKTMVQTDNYKESNGSSSGAIYATFIDLISIKNIRPFNGILAIGSYLWILLSIFFVYYGLKKNNAPLLIISSLSIVFGLSTQTGTLEMIYYRGRSGWYLMFLSILGISIFFNTIHKEKYKNKIRILLIIILFISFLNPPEFFRRYYKEAYDTANKIKSTFPDKKIEFLTDTYSLEIVSDNFRSLPLSISNLNRDAKIDENFVILEKKLLQTDPILSQQALSTDTDFSNFKYNQLLKNKKMEETRQSITSSPEFLKYKKYWENGNIEVFRMINK